jgi:hypothetical protein
VSSDQIPLYVGIPLALLCLAVAALVIGFGVVLFLDWKGRRDD